MGNGYHDNRSDGILWICFVICCVPHLVETSKNFDYEWRTGPWGKCELDGCGMGGTRRRSVFCSHKTGWTTLFSHCHFLPMPSETESCFKVCEEHRNQVTWAPTLWSDCQRDKPDGPCVRLGGYRERQVPCVHTPTDTILKDNVCEFFSQKPPERQSCELKCPQDCVLSTYSDWTPCDGCFHLYTRRIRKVLVAPLNGGRPCAPLVERKHCPNCTVTYRFQVNAWGPCLRPFHFKNPKMKERSHLHIGYQKREIYCVNSNGTVVGHRYCLDKLHLPDLRNVRSCTIPQDCQVTSWQEWKPINSSCLAEDGELIPGYMYRTRLVRQLPQGDGQRCPPLSNTFQVIGDPSKVPKCPRYEWVISDWSGCELLYHSRKRAERCGPGIHTRAAHCVSKQDGLEISVDSSFCLQPKPLVTKQCHIPCTQNCTVSHWSEWGECGDQTCSSTDNKPTYRFRDRRVLEERGGFGLPCPHLSESQSCIPPPCVQWNVTVLEECQSVDPVKGCGRGTQKTSVTCQDKNGVKVEDDRCVIFTRIHKPSSLRQCYLPCPQDCVISEWSEWSKCSKRCEDRNSGALRTRTRIIYAKAGQGGIQCPDEDDLSEVELCPRPQECNTYIWQVSDWGTCLIPKRSLTCGTGMQTRSVQCYRIDGTSMPSGRCSLEGRPAEKRECTVPCPIDCRLTDWSVWTPCSITCTTGVSDIGISVQTRRRYVIEEGQNGGSLCPDLLIDTRPCSSLSPCSQHHWVVSKWSPCVLPPHYIYCGDGLRARSVRCHDEGGNDTYPDFCLQSTGTMPATTEPCSVNCDQDCRLSNWTEYGQCVGGCNGFKIRTRNLIGDSKHKNVCRNQMKYPLVEKTVCLCSEFEPILIGDWSACILDDTAADQASKDTLSKESNDLASFLEDMKKFDLTTASSLRTNLPKTERMGDFGVTDEVNFLSSYLNRPQGDAPGRPVISRKQNCGIGTRYRLFLCQSQVEPGVFEPAYNCSSALYSEEMCIIPCPEDCEMTMWSDWTPCSVTCGSGVQTRKRQIIKHGMDGGRKCPDIKDGKEIETRVCSAICRTNTWRTGQWSQCHAEGSTGINKDVLCGIGVTTRSVDCVKMSNFYNSPKDSAFFCRSEPRPSGREICEMPCPGKCVVSDWSTWSDCSKNCSDKTKRHRIRLILRQPASENDSCPPLKEEEPCIKGHNCGVYNWTVSDWSSCVLEEKAGDCGIGWRQRYLTCQYTDGRKVDNFKCKQLHGELDIHLMEACNKTCDVNCALSEWSSWSDCDQNCGLGMLKRNRTVLYPAEGYGRQCPEELEQSKSCFIKACYNLLISNWTTCQLKKGACGHSVEHRTVECVNQDGVPVHLDRCSDQVHTLPTIQTERPCSISCPGECVLSSWSEWSDCYVHCSDFHKGDKYGLKTRSRVILLEPKKSAAQCPRLFDYQPCVAENCFSFVWRKSDWLNGKREVWCSRSDGVNVTGGCKHEVKPAEDLSCTPACLANHSICLDSDLCACVSPYSPVYDLHQTTKLLDCVMALNDTKPSAAQTVYLPGDGLTNFWMYAVLAAGSLFIIFVIVALYTIWRRDHKQTPNVELASQLSGSVPSKHIKMRKSSRSPEPTDMSQPEDLSDTHLLTVPTGSAKNGGTNPTHGITAKKPPNSSVPNSPQAARPNGIPLSASLQECPESEEVEVPSETSALLEDSGETVEDSPHIVTAVVHAECQSPDTPNTMSNELQVSSVSPKSNGLLPKSNLLNGHKKKSNIDKKLPRSPDNKQPGALNDSCNQYLESNPACGQTSLSKSADTQNQPLKAVYNSNLDPLKLTDNGDAQPINHVHTQKQAVANSKPKESGSSPVERSDSPTERSPLDEVPTLPRETLSNINQTIPSPISETHNPKKINDVSLPFNQNGVCEVLTPPTSESSVEKSPDTCVIIHGDSQDSDSDLPHSTSSSLNKLPITNSREDLAEMITTV